MHEGTCSTLTLTCSLTRDFDLLESLLVPSEHETHDRSSEVVEASVRPAARDRALGMQRLVWNILYIVSGTKRLNKCL